MITRNSISDWMRAPGTPCGVLVSPYTNDIRWD